MTTKDTIATFTDIHSKLMTCGRKYLPVGEGIKNVKDHYLDAAENPPSIEHTTNFKSNSGGTQFITHRLVLLGNHISVEEEIAPVSGGIKRNELSFGADTAQIKEVFMLGAAAL